MMFMALVIILPINPQMADANYELTDFGDIAANSSRLVSEAVSSAITRALSMVSLHFVLSRCMDMHSFTTC